MHLMNWYYWNVYSRSNLLQYGKSDLRLSGLAVVIVHHGREYVLLIDNVPQLCDRFKTAIFSFAFNVLQLQCYMTSKCQYYLLVMINIWKLITLHVTSSNTAIAGPLPLYCDKL